MARRHDVEKTRGLAIGSEYHRVLQRMGSEFRYRSLARAMAVVDERRRSTESIADARGRAEIEDRRHGRSSPGSAVAKANAPRHVAKLRFIEHSSSADQRGTRGRQLRL